MVEITCLLLVQRKQRKSWIVLGVEAVGPVVGGVQLPVEQAAQERFDRDESGLAVFVEDLRRLTVAGGSRSAGPSAGRCHADCTKKGWAYDIV